jgi:cyclopropane-fatty-acyl-phospholipid synthase
MNTLASSARFELPAAAPTSARIAFAMLRKLQVGTLDVQLPDGEQRRFGSGRSDEPAAAIRLRDWDVCSAALKSGDIGFAESFIDGHWSTPDLAALLRLFIANREPLEAVIYGSWWGGLLHRLKHLFNRNSRSGSRRNIHAHYDLGNRFYKLWLDETMNYSSAWFEGDLSRNLPQAQHAKVARALREAGVRRGERMLEIGCGWGAVAEAATLQGVAQVVGVTLSTEQLAYAQERMAQLPQAARADLRLQDYRDIQDGPFDAIVSIEMFEAVGQQYWGQYFETLRRNLKPGRKACIQTITIRDDLFARYLKSSDFIQQYIFPGGVLPSPSAFRAEARKAGLEVVNELAFGRDYAETLRRWRQAFLSQDEQVLRLGFDGRFLRIWEFYLAYCEAAFDTGNTDVMQFTLRRSAAGVAS